MYGYVTEAFQVLAIEFSLMGPNISGCPLLGVRHLEQVENKCKQEKVKKNAMES